MLESILQHIESGVGRQILNWHRLVNFINLKSEIWRTRFLRSGFVYNNGMNLLIHLLNDGMTPEVIDAKSDVDAYLKCEAFARTCRNQYDPVYAQRHLLGYFVENRNVPEYILNCTCKSPMKRLPLDLAWGSDWEQLKPFRILWHDSKELNLDLWRMKIPFAQKQPTRMFYSLDLPMLLMMYRKYSQYYREQNQPYRPEEFLQNYVAYSWFDDLIRIWLTHMLTDMINLNFDAKDYKCPELLYSISTITTVYPEVRQIAVMANRRAISVGDIFATKWFGQQSLKGYLDELNQAITVPPFNQYTALEFIFMLPYYQFIINVMKSIDRMDIQYLARQLLYDLRMWQNRNIASALYDPMLKQSINQELAKMIKTMKSIVWHE